MAIVVRCDSCGAIVNEDDASKLYIDNDVDMDICPDCKRKLLIAFKEDTNE